MNPRGEFFGFDRLEQFMVSCNGLTAAEVIADLRRKLGQFVGRARQHDDITMVVVRIE